MSEFEILTIQQGNREFALSVIVAIVSFVSAVIVYIDYRNRKNKERAEKSIQIAEEFAKSILVPLSIIDAVFEKAEIDKLINKISFIRFTDFDIDELNELFEDKDIEEYKKLLNENDSKGKIRNIIGHTLNILEYMCMNIATKVADEKYIYNSLHQQFLKAIALLYFEISLINIDNKDKYYTNIIHVYNIWKNKYIKAAKKESKFKIKQKKMKKKICLPTPKI